MIEYCTHTSDGRSCTCGGLIGAHPLTPPISPLYSISNNTTLEDAKKPTGETRIVDPSTGGAKGQKDVQMSMVPPKFLEDLGRLYAFGAKKYDRNNWKRGYKWSLTVDALFRHLFAVLKGEWVDKETGLPHIVAVGWHCIALYTFYNDQLGTDDVGIDRRGVESSEPVAGAVNTKIDNSNKSLRQSLSEAGWQRSHTIEDAFRKGS